MGSIVWPLFLAALNAMSKVFLLCAVGIVGGLFPRSEPVLTKQTLKGMSKVLTHIVLPASMFAGWGSTLSVSVLAELWIIIPWSFFNTILSLTVAWPLFHLARLPGRLSSVLAACCAFHNSVALPLLMLDSLCVEGALPMVENCRQQAMACCFVYLIPFHLLFWTVGFSILTEKPGNEAEADLAASKLLPEDIEEPDAAPVALSLERTVTDEPMQHTDSVGGSRRLLLFTSNVSQGPLNSYKRPCINLSKMFSLTPTIKQMVLNPAIVAMPFALVCGLVDPLRENLFGPDALLQPIGAAIGTLNDTMLGTSSLILAGSLVAQEGWLSGAKIPKKHLVIPLFVLVRLILIPILGISAFWAVKMIAPRLVGGVLTQVTIMMQFASPSSMSAVVLLQSCGSQETAGAVAYLYTFQHIATVFVLTLVTTLAMYLATTF